MVRDAAGTVPGPSAPRAAPGAPSVSSKRSDERPAGGGQGEALSGFPGASVSLACPGFL